MVEATPTATTADRTMRRAIMHGLPYCSIRGYHRRNPHSWLVRTSLMADVEIVLHPIPSPDSRPYIIVHGPDRQLWVCESGTSKSGGMAPAHGRSLPLATPTPATKPVR